MVASSSDKEDRSKLPPRFYAYPTSGYKQENWVLAIDSEEDRPTQEVAVQHAWALLDAQRDIGKQDAKVIIDNLSKRLERQDAALEGTGPQFQGISVTLAVREVEIITLKETIANICRAIGIKPEMAEAIADGPPELTEEEAKFGQSLVDKPASVEALSTEILEVLYSEECMFSQKCWEPGEHREEGRHHEECPLEKLRIVLGKDV